MNKTKTALITGGSKRIGKSISEYFHAQGFNIALHYNHSYIEATKLSNSLNKKRNNSCKIFKADLTQEEIVYDFIKGILKEYSDLKVLINNASSFYPTPIESVSLENWHDLSFTNLVSPIILIKGLKDLLNKNAGCIINISDAMASKGINKFSLYSAAKAGLETITKSFAKELSPHIRVNAIAPGAILWPELQESDDGNQKKSILDSIPLGRTGDAQDIAAAAYFLSQSLYMTGQVINVDGGLSLS